MFTLKLLLSNILTFPTFGVLWRCGPTRAMASSFLRFLDHTQRRTTVGRTPLDVWSARRRDLYLVTHNTHNRQTYMPPVGFEPTISAGERPQTYPLDRAATGTGWHLIYTFKIHPTTQFHMSSSNGSFPHGHHPAILHCTKLLPQHTCYISIFSVLLKEEALVHAASVARAPTELLLLKVEK